MALLLKAIATDDRVLWAQCLKDRLPEILKLTNNYEHALQTNKNASQILKEIYTSIQTTLQSAIELAEMPPQKDAVKKKLTRLLFAVKRLKNAEIKKVPKKKPNVKLAKVPKWIA